MAYPSFPQAYHDEQAQHDFPSLGVLSVWFGAILIAVTAVGAGFDTPSESSWTEPLVDMLQFVLIALILASLAYLFLNVEEGWGLKFVPLFVNIGILLIIQLVPFTQLWQEARFQWHQPGYRTVVQNIENGTWPPGNDNHVALPAAYQHLSLDDEQVWVQQDDTATAILFVTSRSEANDFAGYIYRSDGRAPQVGEFDGHWVTVVQKRAHWYYCVSASH